MSFRKDADDLVAELERAGWRVRKGKANHYKAYCPCGQHLLSFGSTPSDSRSIKNARALARRFLRECATNQTKEGVR